MLTVDNDSFRHPWLGVEVRHLAALAAIARRGSFSRAAEDLGYVQSAVSQQILRLERTVGVRLIERQRGHRNVHLTPAGELLAAHARRMVRELQAARLDITAVEKGADTPLVIGVGLELAETLLPVVRKAVADRESELSVGVVEARPDEELLRHVEHGSIDVGISSAYVEPSTFASRSLARDRYVAVVGHDSLLARHEGPIEVASLAPYELIVPPSSSGFAPAELQLVSAGLDLERAVRSPFASTQLAFVASGLGVAVMPRLSVERQAPGVVCRELAGASLPCDVAVFWQRHRRVTDSLERVAQLARDSVPALDASGFELVA